MTVPHVVVPVDPREIMLELLQPLLPAILPGWRCGWRQDQGIVDKISPGRFIALDVLSDAQLSNIHDQYVIVAQIWGDNGISDDKMRTRAARIVSAHLAQGLNGRRNSLVPSLPDPFDDTRTRYITQVTMTALLRGEDQ